MARSDAATLSRIETGKQNLTAETLGLYLVALNVTPKEFFGGKTTDTLTVVTVWSGDQTTPAALVGGSHKFRFVRDTSIH